MSIGKILLVAVVVLGLAAFVATWLPAYAAPATMAGLGVGVFLALLSLVAAAGAVVRKQNAVPALIGLVTALVILALLLWSMYRSTPLPPTPTPPARPWLPV